MRSKLPSLNFDGLLWGLVAILMHLCPIIFSIKWVDGVISCAVWAGKRVQCMMLLFLRDTFSDFKVDRMVSSATSD